MCALSSKNLRGGAAVLVDLLDIGKSVERAGGRLAFQAHFIQRGHQQVAALAILLAIGGDLRLRRFERVDHRILHGCGDAVGGVENDLAQRGHERLLGHRIAGAPSGHRIGLRESEAGDGSLKHAGQRRDGDMLAVVDQVFIGFVGDDDQVALDGEGGNLFGFGAREDQAAGILRRVVVDGARLAAWKTARGSCEFRCGGR